MELIEQFKQYLLSQKKLPSRITVKNYKADVRQFIRWFEAYFNRKFEPQAVTSQILELYKNPRNQPAALSSRSLERHLSSLRKFFQFLKIEGIIRVNPFELDAKRYTLDADPWHLKDFKNYLYIYNASHLTIKNYIIDVRQFLKWVKEVTGIEEAFDVKEKNVFNKINAALLEEYKNRLLQTSFSPASVNRKLSSLRKYLGWAVEQDLLKTQIQSQVFRRQAEGVGVATSMVKGQKGSSAAAKTKIGRQNQNEYSRLAPIRLGQKLSKGISFLFDAILVAPLAKILEQGDYLLWKIKGKPIFGKRAVTGKTKISVSNLKKELYAPYKVSTKYFPLSKKIFFHLRHTRPKWYQTYHSHSITHYFHLAILIIFTSAVGFGLYQTYIQEPQTRKSLLAAAPASPPRILSFQGRLTDAQDNPITTEKLIRFQIYNDPTATGSGSLLWQEVNKIIPDTDGIFSILLGNTSLVCSDPLAPASGPCLIPQSLFAENATLYLGITIENDSELKPRQQLATVAYAVNAEVLQGMPPTTDSTLKTNSNAILALNSSGTLAIGGTATTTFQTTNGQFKLTGQPLLLTTNPGTSQNISIEPDGIGKIDLRKPLQNTSNNNNISSASGALEIDDSLLILATSSGQSALIINQNGTGPLISASTSGTAKFTVDNTGRGYFADSVGIGTTNSYNFKVQVEGSIGPNSDLQHYLGSSSKRWARVYTNELIGGTSGIQGYWQRNSQALSPTAITDDLLLGATATASALVKLTGTSGNNSWINTGNVGIGDTSPASTLTVGDGDLFQVAGATGNITTAGDLAVNGGDLTTSATTFNLVNATATTVNFAGAATSLSLGASTGTTTVNNALSVSGRATFSQAPTQAHTGTWAIGSSTWNQANATIYINPASATADSNLIGAAVAGSVVFSLDAEGDIFGRNLVLTGSTSTGNTTIAGDLSVEGNTTLGDTPTDTLTINPTAWTATPTISGAVTMTSGFDSNAASTVAGLTVDGNGNLTVSNGTLSVTAPSTTGNAAAVAANSLTTGTALDLSSTSTAGGASGVSTLLKLTRSGINANLAHTAYGLYSTVTNTNATSGTNIAGYFSASGATTANYGLIVAAGNVGIGTGSPQAKTMIVDSQTSTSVNGAATLVLANKDTTANNYTGLYISDSDDSAKLGWIAWKLKRGANKDTTLELGTQVSGVGGTRMVIDGGSVGIGTTSPGAKLDIAVSNAPADPSAGGIYLYNSGTTTTSDAIIATRVSGATGGNPFYSLDIFGVVGWSMGVDNADSDKFKIMKSWNLDGNPYLTIDTSGNVGIGTTGPGAPLEVRGASGGVVYISTASGPNTALWFREGTTNKGIVGVGDAGNIFTGASADSFSIRAEGDLHLGGTGDNLAMTIKSGNVGIGTTSPSGALEVDQTGTGYGIYINGTTGTRAANTASLRLYDVRATTDSNGWSANLMVQGGNTALQTAPLAYFYSYAASPQTGLLIDHNATGPAIDISSAGGYALIARTGSVGIGTTSPGAKLDIAVSNAPADPSAGGIYLYNSGTTTTSDAIIATRVSGATGGNPFYSLDIFGVVGWSMGVDNADSDKFKIMKSWNLDANPYLTIDTSGNVGIGDSTPTEGTLVVAGTIYATTQATGVNEAVLGGRTLTAGAGLTGTGNLTADRTFNVGAGTCITANADDVAVTADCIGDTQLAYNTGQHLTTTSTPQFARLGLGAAADGTYLLNLNGALVHGTSTGVGIGATDPASKLEIQGAGGSQEDILRLKSVPTAATHGPFISFEGASGNNVTGAIGQEDDGILGESDIVFRASNSGAKTSIATLNELVRFKHDGSVGIGTTGPSSKLDVNGYIYARNPESAGGYVRIGGLDTYRGIYADGLLAIGAGANAIVLNGTGSGTGNVGIGTATPTNAKLEVNGNIYIPAANSLILGDTGRVIKAPHTAALGSMVFTGHTAAYSPLWSFRDQNDTAIMAIGAGTGNNNVGIGTTSPGAKLEVTGDIWLSKDDNRQILLATGTTTGRNLSIIAGGGSDGVGGTLNLRGGNGAVSGGGGSVFIYGGSGFGSSGNVTLGHDGTNVIGDVYVGMDTQYSQRLCHSGADGATGRFILGDCSGGGADLAEYYGAEKNSEPGDVVSIHPNQNLATVKSSIPYDNKLLGVISTQPYDVMGNTVPQEDNPQPVALIGRAPVKVSTENGPIAIGDPLTSSSQPGVAMKATKAGPIVGKALEAFDADGNTCSKSSTSEESKATSEVTGTCQGKIMAFVNVSWYDPDVYLTSTGDLNIVLQPFSNETMQQSASGSGEMATLLNGYIVKDAADRVIDRVGAFAELAVANLRTGLLEAQEITTNSLTVTSDSVTIDGQSLRNYIASLVSETLNSQLSILNPQKIVSPLAEVDIVRTNVISPLASNDVTIRLGASQGNTSEVTGTGSSDGGKLIIENASGSAVASIDSSGNARLAGDLQARQASFSGQLSSNQLTSNEASIAGTLRAKNIIADSIEGLDQRIASSKLATSSGQNNYTLDANKLDADLASFSAQLAYIENLSADFVKFNQGLMVFGPASFADVSVVGQFSVGGNLILADNSINVLGSNLELQPLKQGSLSIMGGLVNIDTEGNLKVGGNAEFARDVTVRGNLAANIISPIPDQDLVIRLGASQGNTSDGDPQGLLRGEGIGEQQFRIENASGSAVLAVNQQGDLTASGSGNFSDILAKTFNIVRSAQADTSMTETIATSSAGTATIIAGETERTIVSPYVAEKSLIYITPTSDTQGATPYVARQTKGLFTIQIPRRVYQDINLNWWIAN